MLMAQRSQFCADMQDFELAYLTHAHVQASGYLIIFIVACAGQ